MVRFEFEFDPRGFQRRIRRTVTAIESGVSEGLREHGNEHIAQVLKRGTRGRPGLNRRSGRLANNTTTETKGGSLQDIELNNRVSGVPYARIQTTGGRVKARPGRYLTIPLDASLTGAGVWRDGSARRLIGRLGRRAHWYNTGTKRLSPIGRRGARGPQVGPRKRPRPSKPGNLFIVEASPGAPSQTWKFHVLLKKEIEIPPRFPFFSIWTEMRPKLVPRLQEKVRRRLIASRGGNGRLS